jgi:hypothetical protein
MAPILTIPDDAHFPQSEVITNKQAMKEIFQERLPGFAEGRLQIDALDLLHFHYKPGARCEVCYALQVKDLTTGRAGSQILSGVVKPNGAAAKKYAKAQIEAHFQPEFGPAIHFFSDLKMLLWGFPNDPRLKQLPQLLDHRRRLEIFRSALPRFVADAAPRSAGQSGALQFPPEIKLAEAATKLIKYAPADRCTLRHDLRLSNGKALTIYSKTFNHKTDGAQIFKIMQALWNDLLRGHAGALMIPEPLFFVAELNTLFVNGLEGKNLDEHLAEIDLNKIAAAIGAGLARLQQCRLEELSLYFDHEMLSAVGEVAEASEIHHTAVSAIVKTLREKYSTLTPITPAPIHGAFRLSQLLLVNDKLALIDFDGFRCGNPLVDVGSFVAHLLYLPLREKLTMEQSRAAVRHFCRAYAEAAPWGLPADVLAWQTAAHLIGQQAKKCLTLAKKNHPVKISVLIDCANAILAEPEQWSNGVME